MKHIYQDIDGWFTFPTFYSKLVEQARSGFHFVEVGAWKGKSTAYMGVEIANSNKKIRFDCIDTWQGNPDWDEPLLKTPNALYEHFLDNIKLIKEFVNPIRSTSVDASMLYQDKTIDCVFIDGDHEYQSVCEDINCWLPKIRAGGLLSGHDFAYEPVKKALADTLKSGFVDYGNQENVWIFKVA